MSTVEPLNRPTEVEIARIVSRAVELSLLSEDRPVAAFFDLDRYAHQLRALASAFPSPTLNALAVKATPLVGLLHRAAVLGFGAECASLGELHVAKKAGFPPERVVFDSPAKTRTEIEYALNHGYYLNIDNLQELDRIELLISQGFEPHSPLGLRINPLTGAGRDERLSTATATAKFGVPIAEAEAYLRTHPAIGEWLSGLHVHVGSQGTPLKLMVLGVRGVVDFATRINERYGFTIHTIDIGGGLSVRFGPNDQAPGFQAYANALGAEVPELYGYRIITEFGRSVFAHAGWVVTRVEYTKKLSDRHVAIVQVGADLFLRCAYWNWYHELLVLDATGNIRAGPTMPFDIAGPLCYSGDYITRERLVPQISPGDWLVIRDAGAYTLGMRSQYLTRAFPPVYGYDAAGTMDVIHPGAAAEDAAGFWG